MDKKLFSALVESMTQMNEIARGERASSREFAVDALGIQEIRKSTGLSQAQFAAVIDVQVSTLRNWEQGRRAPTGPARALFKALKNDPHSVLRALSAPERKKPRAA